MAKILETNCLHCKEHSDIFKVLKREEVEKVNCQRTSIHYNAGEVIFKQGAPCHYFVCVTSGLVKLYIEHSNNRNLIIGLTRPINYIFEPGAFVDLHHHLTAVAVEETSACLIDISIIKDLIKTNTEFSNEFIKKISTQAVDLFGRISSCTQKHVYGRVADTLLYLHPHVYPQNPCLLTVSRQEMADLSGMTKESLIRVLKKFKEDGILSLEGNHLEILKRENLQVISQKG